MLLRSGEDDGEEAEPESPPPNAIGALNVPKRSIYCLDLRIEARPEIFLSEIRRIAREATVETVSLDFFGLKRVVGFPRWAPFRSPRPNRRRPSKRISLALRSAAGIR